jgi:glycosyltransferase involved in cell wall biosynthesis
MPTANRRSFVSQAIAYFRRQDYVSKELVIVDDGGDCVADLIPGVRQIKYLRLEKKQSLGAKRNLACTLASGALICHWDDDDWIAPWRIGYQVRQLLQVKADVGGLKRLYFYDPFGGRSYRYDYPRKKTTLLAGGSLCYLKRFWEQYPFAEVNQGEDTRFLWNDRPKKVWAHQDNTFYVALIHPANTNPRYPTRQRWSTYPLAEMETMLGADLAFYRSLPHSWR